MKRVIFLVMLLLLMVGCRQSQQEGEAGTAELTIELMEPAAPTMSGDTEMVVRVTDAADRFAMLSRGIVPLV